MVGGENADVEVVLQGAYAEAVGGYGGFDGRHAGGGVGGAQGLCALGAVGDGGLVIAELLGEKAEEVAGDEGQVAGQQEEDVGGRLF